MNKDVSSILDLIGQLSESVTTPVDVNHGLNAQQKSVPQLPAQARAKKTSVLAAKKDPRHPFAGYMVGSNESVNPDAALDEADFNPGRRGFLKKAGAAAATAAMPKGLAGAAVKAVSPSVAKASVALTDKELHDLVAKIWDQDAEEFAQEILSGGGESLSPAQAAYLKQQAKAYKLDLRDPDSAESFVSAMTEQLPDEYVDRIGGDSGDRQGGFGGDHHDMEADYFDEKGNWAGNSEWDDDNSNNRDNGIDWDAEEDEYEPFEDHEVIDQLQKSYHLTPAEAKRTFEYGLQHFRPRRGVWSSFLYGPEDVLGWTEKYGYGNRPPDSAIPGGPDKPASVVGKAAGRIGNVIGRAAKQYVDKNVDDVKSHVKDFYNKPAALPAPSVSPGMQIPKQKTPAALPAPSVSPGMQIPKQKTKVTSPFNDDHSDIDQFVKEEWNTERTGDWTGEWDVSLNTPPNYRVKVKAPTAEFAVDTLRKRGMTGFKDATDDQIDVSPITDRKSVV